MIDQNPCPASAAPDSRRSETVTTSEPAASTARARMAGDGYCAVPRNRRDFSSVP